MDGGYRHPTRKIISIGRAFTCEMTTAGIHPFYSQLQIGSIRCTPCDIDSPDPRRPALHQVDDAPEGSIICIVQPRRMFLFDWSIALLMVPKNVWMRFGVDSCLREPWNATSRAWWLMEIVVIYWNIRNFNFLYVNTMHRLFRMLKLYGRCGPAVFHVWVRQRLRDLWRFRNPLSSYLRRLQLPLVLNIHPLPFIPGTWYAPMSMEWSWYRGKKYA